MRLVLFAALALVASSAAADPKPKPAVAGTEEAKPAACKRRWVGRGLERKAVCEFDAPIVVGVEAPKPKVLVVPVDGRKVVGRPKLTDPFAGLERRR